MTDLMGFSPDEFIKIYSERYIYQVLQKNFGGVNIFATNAKPIYVPDIILNAYQRIGMDKIVLTPFVQILFAPNDTNDDEDDYDSDVAYCEDEYQIKPFMFSTDITHEEIMLIEDRSVHPVLIAGLKPNITCKPILHRFMKMTNAFDDNNSSNSTSSTLLNSFVDICKDKLYAPLVCEDDDNSVILNAILTNSLLDAFENSDINGIFNPEFFADEVGLIVKSLFGLLNENMDDFKNHLLNFAEMVGSISCDLHVHDNDPEVVIYNDGGISHEWSMQYGAHLTYFTNGLNLKKG